MLPNNTSLYKQMADAENFCKTVYHQQITIPNPPMAGGSWGSGYQGSMLLIKVEYPPMELTSKVEYQQRGHRES